MTRVIGMVNEYVEPVIIPILGKTFDSPIDIFSTGLTIEERYDALKVIVLIVLVDKAAFVVPFMTMIAKLA